MTDLFLDIETYVGPPNVLAKSGVYRYVEEPSWEIMMCAWAVDDGPVEVAIGAAAIDAIPGLWDPAVMKYAHNAQFERVNFSRLRYVLGEGDWPDFLPPEEWTDSMALAAENGYPQSLEGAAQVLAGEQKDKAGAALVRFFCQLNRGKRNLPQDHPEKWAAFVEYCRQDVATLRSIVRRVGTFPTRGERAVWDADQRINDRGLRLDVGLAQAAYEAAEANQLAQKTELGELTGVENPGSTAQLLKWFNDQGLRSMKNLQKETVESYLASTAVNSGTPKAERVKRALELRLELALVASKKYEAALRGVSSDGRLRGQFRFHGAHTGRWTSRSVQLQNLARLSFKTDAERDAAIVDLALGEGADPETLKKLVRSMFLGPFGVVDYSAIEARVVAWLAGEEWVLEAFRGGRDIYVETAARMSTPENELTRHQGKVAVLALGYQGAVASLRAMGGEGSDEELRLLVDTWRAANPQIVRYWGEMEAAFLAGGSVGPIEIEARGADRTMRLPSGRGITYHNIRLNESFFDPKKGRSYRATGFDDPRRAGGRTSTYGGRLVENATQATARDVLADALVRLHKRGYEVVGHVHDEALIELGGRDPETALREIEKVMCTVPRWAEGLPINAEGFTCYRYKKG